MRAARVPVEKGHVSLHVFHLAPERRQDAVAMMREVAAEFAAEESASLRLGGAKTFPGSRDDAF